MWGATTKSNDIFDKLNTSIDRFGRGDANNRAAAMARAKNRASTMHQKAKISATFTSFGTFWPFRSRPMEALEEKIQR
jgi:hypothetical protein